MFSLFTMSKGSLLKSFAPVKRKVLFPKLRNDEHKTQIKLLAPWRGTSKITIVKAIPALNNEGMFQKMKLSALMQYYKTHVLLFMTWLTETWHRCALGLLSCIRCFSSMAVIKSLHVFVNQVNSP